MGKFLMIMFFLFVFCVGVEYNISTFQYCGRCNKKTFKVSERKAIIIHGIILVLVGLLPTLSTTPILENITLFGKSFFDLYDCVSSNILLPLTGLLIIAFIFFVVKEEEYKNFLVKQCKSNEKLVNIFLFLTKYITPLLILIVWVNTLLK